MWIDHILLIHSCVNGHLGCFCIWAIVNGATMNVPVQAFFFWIPILNSFWYFPRVELLLYTLILCLNSSGPAQFFFFFFFFFAADKPFYIPTRNAVFQCLHILNKFFSLVVVRTILVCMKCSLSFWFVAPLLLMMLSIFSYSYWPFVYFFEEYLFKSFVHFQVDCLPFCCWNCKSSLYIPDTRLLSDTHFSSFFRLPFNSPDSIHDALKFLICWSSIYLFFLLLFMPLMSHLRIHCQIQRSPHTFSSMSLYF